MDQALREKLKNIPVEYDRLRALNAEVVPLIRKKQSFDIDDLAKRHGLTPERVREQVKYWNAVLEGTD